ncbi:hypothetical protein MMC11_008169 [Xylographa trunciseda]|nr:hypothetical protein [Xylographa trunciseda]
MESQSERIVGDETLGMESQTFDPNVSSYGTNSIPPMMSAQIELMTTTRILQPLKKAVLKRLQRLVKKNDMRSWFSIYLCMFVLLHSCSILTADEYRQAKKYGLKTRYVYDSFVEELHMGAKTMIYYFHYCNKGSYPFARDWTSKENLALAELNEEQANFLKESSVLVRERMPEFKKVMENGDFENDWYFVAQLYDMNWKPRFTI